MRSLKKRGPHVLDDLNDLLFSLQYRQQRIGVVLVDFRSTDNNGVLDSPVSPNALQKVTYMLQRQLRSGRTHLKWGPLEHSISDCGVCGDAISRF